MRVASCFGERAGYDESDKVNDSARLLRARHASFTSLVWAVASWCPF